MASKHRTSDDPDHYGRHASERPVSALAPAPYRPAQHRANKPGGQSVEQIRDQPKTNFSWFGGTR